MCIGMMRESRLVHGDFYQGGSRRTEFEKPDDGSATEKGLLSYAMKTLLLAPAV